MNGKSGCIVKTNSFIKTDLNFTMKTRFSIEENSIMYRKSRCIIKKTSFIKKDLNFTSKTKSSISNIRLYS